VIAVVGVCGAGKTTLIAGLKEHGIEVRHVAQEHSYVEDMWQRLVKPDLLIYLDTSYEDTINRRKLNWTMEEYLEQLNRLRHARKHCDLYLSTSGRSPSKVIEAALEFLKAHGVGRLIV